MLLHEQQLFRLPNELSDEQGVMLEPTAIALHALLHHLPQANDNVLIIGAGTIGLLTLHLLHTLVPNARISMLARHPFQVEYAIRLGADHIVYPIDPYINVQRATHAQLYKGMLGNRTIVGGYDFIYDTVGEQNTLHHALRWLRTHGTMILVGLNIHMMHIDLTPIWHRELKVLGSLSHGKEAWPLGTSADTSTFSVATELIRQKRIQPEQLITHRFALNKYKDALSVTQHKKRSQAIKVLFDYALLPASAVPNVRASARVQHPELSQPQGHAFMEEILQAQNAIGSQPGPAQEVVPQSNSVQQTLPPRILDTPPPQAFPDESWPPTLNEQDVNQDDSDEDTDPTIPVRRAPFRPRVSPKVVEPPQTPIPAAIELTHTPAVETPETDESAAGLLSAQLTQEPQQAEAASESSLSIDQTQLQFPVELPDNEEEPISSFPEVVDTAALTEEQLPAQTVLDNLFNADTSSMPEFLAQLSDLGALNPSGIPMQPIDNAADSLFSDTTSTALPVEDIDAAVSSDGVDTTEPGEHADAPTLPAGSDTAISVGLADATVLLAGSDVTKPGEHVDAPTLPTDSDITEPGEHVDAAVLPDSSDQTDSIPITMKPRAKKKRKSSGVSPNSAATKNGSQGEKKQIEEKTTQEPQSD
jgi:NADPH:quinone reductase-like Zn-dependent oxidoreductase